MAPSLSKGTGFPEMGMPVSQEGNMSVRAPPAHQMNGDYLGGGGQKGRDSILMASSAPALQYHLGRSGLTLQLSQLLEARFEGRAPGLGQGHFAVPGSLMSVCLQ